ncbi:divergent polysaccharide deacetylase family protein [Caldicellulosiruptoraceae bacterium PP1]
MKKTFLVVIKKAQIARFFIPALALFCILVLLFVYFFYNPASSVETSVKQTVRNKYYVALVFDDAGMDENEVKKLLDLKIPFDVAIIPFLPFSNKIALMCHNSNKEVLIHFSMEPETGDASWLAPRSIMDKTPDDEIEKTFKDALVNIPYAKGFNNHMGSLLCKNKRIVNKLVTLAKDSLLFVLDSKTTPKSLFEPICKEHKVSYIGRDIFLDNKNEVLSIKSQLNLLKNTAKKKGYAVGIGHLGPEGGITTITAVSEMIDEMKKEGIEFVFVSDIIKIKETSEAK